MTLSRTSRLWSCVIGAAALVLVSTAPAAHAASHAWTVDIGDQPTTATATYPSATVPSDTARLSVALPTGFDWAPDDLAAPAPTVTWSVERAGAVVGADAVPAAPDTGTPDGFGSSVTIDFATLPTAPVVGDGYALRIRAVWSAAAPENAGDVLDLTAPFEVTADPVGGDVAFDLRFTRATTETRTFEAEIDGRPTAGDRVHLSTAGAGTPWTWTTGPDADNAWATGAQVYGGLGTGPTDPMHPTQPMDVVFSVSTPDPTVLVAPLPDVIFAGTDTMALTVSSRDIPDSGPLVTVRVNVALSLSGAASDLVASPEPAITGTAVYGQTLRVTTGSWAPRTSGNWAFEAPGLHYQWYRGGHVIAGATGTTHALVVADVGTFLTVRVTASSRGYVTTTEITAPVTVRPAAAPRATVRPTLTGVAKVRRTLSAHRGTWSPTPSTFRYQWLDNGRVIRAATGTTYKVPKALKGHRVSCRVAVSKPGHAGGTSVTTTRVIR